MIRVLYRIFFYFNLEEGDDSGCGADVLIVL